MDSIYHLCKYLTYSYRKYSQYHLQGERGFIPFLLQSREKIIGGDKVKIIVEVEQNANPHVDLTEIKISREK